MKLSRREFLRVGGTAAAALSLSACSTAGRRIAQDALPALLLVPDEGQGAQAEGDPLLRLLNRGGYGPRPGDLDRARELGMQAFLEEQLAPEKLDDTAAELMLRGFTYYPMEIDQLLNQEVRDVSAELLAATAVRALYSKRQLYETMVEFWSDHFNIYLRKNEYMPFLKLVDDRDVIRPHALGNFRDLLFASARSPAMLVYLDNIQSSREAPNENYARELMELHTLGVNGGYTQEDVEQLARALTGWGTARRGAKRGQYVFHPEQHDDSVKVFLGQTLPAGKSDADVLQALELLAVHSSTAYFLAAKLVRRFVADHPPDSLVQQVAETFISTDGDIKAMLRVVFLSPEFAGAPAKLKRPFTYMISALRALNADVGWRGYRRLWSWLERMGQPLFHWPPPDGYPDTADSWAANLLPRWNFAAALVGQGLDGVHVPLEEILRAGGVRDTAQALQVLAGVLYNSPLDTEMRQLMEAHAGMGNVEDTEVRRRITECIGLMLSGPAFQWI